jgi:hypothetical protein
VNRLSIQGVMKGQSFGYNNNKSTHVKCVLLIITRAALLCCLVAETQAGEYTFVDRYCASSRKYDDPIFFFFNFF